MIENIEAISQQKMQLIQDILKAEAEIQQSRMKDMEEYSFESQNTEIWKRMDKFEKLQQLREKFYEEQEYRPINRPRKKRKNIEIELSIITKKKTYIVDFIGRNLKEAALLLNQFRENLMWGECTCQ